MDFINLPALLRALKSHIKTAGNDGAHFEGEYEVERDHSLSDDKEYIQNLCQHIYLTTGYRCR